MAEEVSSWSGSFSSPEPWQRQDGESRKAFLAWETYRDMVEEPRSYRKVAQELHKSLALIGRWGRQWRWQARLDAWLKYLENVAAAERVQFIKEMNERHASVAKLCLEKIEQTLNDPTTCIPLSVIAKLLAVAVEIERIASGLKAERSREGTSPSCPSFESTQRPMPDDIVTAHFKRLSSIPSTLLRQAYLTQIESAEESGHGDLAKLMRTALQNTDSQLPS